MQTIYLDISNKGVVPTVYAKQNDVGRKFAVILTDSGLPYIPEIGSVFSVWYKGASGEGNYTDIGNKSAFSLNGNKVEVEMIVQMLSAHGDGILCLTLNSPDGNQISSWNIPYICEMVPGSESEKAEEYYTAFSKAVEKLPYPDKTLSIEGKAADAAAVGEALAKKADISYTKKIGNPYNLLDNSDFRNPVNQRGRTSYTDTGYTIDRWMQWIETGGGSTTVHDGYISVAFENHGTFSQRVKKSVLDSSKTYTLTIKIHNGEAIASCPAYIGYGENFDIITIIDSKNTTVTDIEWVALYEGEYTAETLPEYQPKGYGAELLECMRYYEEMTITSGVIPAVMWNGELFHCVFGIPFTARKRISSPTITFVGLQPDGTSQFVCNAGVITVTSFTVLQTTDYAIGATAKFSGVLSAPAFGWVDTFKVIVSADL